MGLDNNSRLLFPKRLLEYAGITKELILFAYSNRIEVWDKNTYENLLGNEPDDFAQLAEEVMGKNRSEKNNDDVS